MISRQSIACDSGLSPNDITPREATPRRVVAQLPVPDGVATRRHFPAWRLQRQGHLARFSRFLVRAALQGRLRHSHTARTRCPTWLIIPLIALGTFSRRSSKKTFMWLINPLHVAQKSPSCGSKISRTWLINPLHVAQKSPFG